VLSIEQRIRDHIKFLYGREHDDQVFTRLMDLIQEFQASNPYLKGTKLNLTQEDAILITYGDQINQPDRTPLNSLSEFAKDHLQEVVNAIHLLPFFPYSSDDGFSVIDYYRVNPELGSWEDIARMESDFRLMFDAVINHISAQSPWFQAFLQDQEPYRDYFILVDPSVDFSAVVRPRALPLLTEVNTPSGNKHVWTTFSDDQIDLNYANPDVLLEIIGVLLFYIGKGAEFIRMDAIAFLSKEIGTPCIHLQKTHRIIQLFRDVVEIVAPRTMLITETNVPHSDNISYFGDGTNEAHMVYNFALPPLLLHTLHTGDATALSKWAGGLDLPSTQTTFFNFLASHDGIGLNPARGILSDEEIEGIITRTQSHGGLVSYKQNPDGSQSPYELNINYFDALSNPDGDEPLEVQVGRFVAAHAVMFSLLGVPGIYFHSLFGSRSWKEGVELTGRNRTINRQKLRRDDIERDLNDTGSLRRMVFERLANLLRQRADQSAFHPTGEQEILEVNSSVFVLLRKSPGGDQRVLCLNNISDTEVPINIDLMELGAVRAVDLNDNSVEFRGHVKISLSPYQISWLSLRN